MKTCHLFSSKHFWISTLIILCIGCNTPVKPNTPYSGQYPAAINDLANNNPLLAKELGKLPEILDGISDKESDALEQIVRLYNSDPKAFDRAFEKMYKIGKPDFREYCSPLQAIFWLAEEGNLKKDIIVDYNLTNLIDKIWPNNKQVTITLTEDQTTEIIGGIRDERLRNQYMQYIANGVDEITIRTIVSNYKTNPSMFSWAGKRSIERAMRNSSDPKWSDYKTVKKRLNAPELIDHYLSNNIAYKKANAHGAYITFKSKKGQCTDAAYFAVAMLKSSGYKTFMRSVRWGIDDWNDVHTGSGVILNDGSYLIVADFGWNEDSLNSLSGPYFSIESVDRRLARGREITVRSWGAFFPPQ